MPGDNELLIGATWVPDYLVIIDMSDDIIDIEVLAGHGNYHVIMTCFDQ